MKKKELQRLRRRDLLELLIDLSKENEQLREQNRNLEAQLNQRTIAVSEAGSLAEAVLRLNVNTDLIKVFSREAGCGRE